MENGSLSERIAELDEFAKKQLGQAQRDLHEVRVLVKQTSTEVERFGQRRSQALAKQREAEINLETIDRELLKQVYVASCESQMRHLMMQAQSEQLQSRQRSLETYIEVLQRTVEVTNSAVAVPRHEVDRVLPSQTSAVASGPRGSTTSQQTVARIIEVQENERDRVARQIHDGPAQALTNVVLRAEICERLIAIDPARARAELGDLRDLITSTLRDTRRFIFDVRPMILDDLGLFPTLRKYLEVVGDQSQCALELSVRGEECRFDPQIEVTAFRIVQEALRNVAHHANASLARITIDVEPAQITITVVDDGVGFDAEAETASAREQTGDSIGMTAMLERIDMVGGNIEFESSPGLGTKLTASIPLSR